MFQALRSQGDGHHSMTNNVKAKPGSFVNVLVPHNIQQKTARILQGLQSQGQHMSVVALEQNPLNLRKAADIPSKESRMTND